MNENSGRLVDRLIGVAGRRGGGRRVGVTRARMLAAVLPVAFGTLLALPLQTQAQTDTTFVSNLGNTDVSRSTFVGNTPWGQEFQTGTNADGYTLTEIVVQMRFGHVGSPAFALYTAKQATATTTQFMVPDTKVVDLSGRVDSPGAQSFTPDSTTVLSASTSYIVQIETTSGSANLQLTSDDVNDSGSSPGWDITPDSLWTNRGSWGKVPDRIKIAVKGTLGAATTTATSTASSTDATLSALVVNDGTNDLTLFPAFAPGTYAYDAEVANATTTVTLTVTVNDAGARVTRVTLGGTAVSDDEFIDGITIPSLVEGDNVIVVTVTAEDASTQDYTVTVSRATATSTVTIATTTTYAVLHGDFSDALEYQLERTDTDGALSVWVDLSSGAPEFVPDGDRRKQVDFVDGEATATLSIPAWQLVGIPALGEVIEGGAVTARLAEGSAYTVGTPGAAQQRVVVWVVGFDARNYEVDERDEKVAVSLTARYEGGGLPAPEFHAQHGLSVSSGPISNAEATSPEDYAAVSIVVLFPEDPEDSSGPNQDFSDGDGDGTYELTHTVDQGIVFDAETEDPERFLLLLELTPGLAALTQIALPDGRRCTPAGTSNPDLPNGCHAIVTINDSPRTVIENVSIISAPAAAPDTYGAGSGSGWRCSSPAT